MKKAIAKQEENATLSKSLRKFLDYALKRKSHSARPTVLIQSTDNGVIVHDTPEAINKVEREATAEHMGKGRKRWYLDAAGKMLQVFTNTDHGKEWRRRLAADTLNESEWSVIPERLRSVYECAKTVNNKNGAKMSAEMYGDIFTSAVSINELNKYISNKKKNTAPGESNIRIDHIAALPNTHREMICNLLSVVYLTGLGYSQWKREIVNLSLIHI